MEICETPEEITGNIISVDLGKNPEGERFGRANYSSAASNASDQMERIQDPDRIGPENVIDKQAEVTKIPGVANWQEGDVPANPAYDRNAYLRK